MWLIKFRTVLCFIMVLGLGCPIVGADTLPLVLTGQIAPGTADARFTSVSAGWVNTSGVIVFRAGLAGANPHSGLFRVSEGALSPIVLEGDLAPDLPGRVFGSLGDARINNAGDVVFNALLNGGSTRNEGIFVWSSQGLRRVVDTETEAPGSTGQKF